MIHVKKLLSIIFISFILISSTAGSSGAAETSNADIHKLRILEEIAGQEVHYQNTLNFEFSLQNYRNSDCILSPDRVHKRKSGNFNTVGAKPRTQCMNSFPASIRHVSVLYIVEAGGLYYREMARVSGGNAGVQSYHTKNLEWFCKNSNSAVFQQHTMGYVVVGGRNLQASTQTIKDKIACGY